MATDGPDGGLTIPRHITIPVLAGAALWLAAQIWAASALVSSTSASFEAINRRLISIDEKFVDERAKTNAGFAAVGESDRRILERGDERWAQVRARLDLLERDRDRLTRVEEKMQVQTELLREIRQAISRRP